MQLFTRPSDLRMDSRWKSKHLSRYERVRERVKNWNPWYEREWLPRELKNIQNAFSDILEWKCCMSVKKSKHVARYERKCKRGSLGRSWREWARSLTLKDISPSWPETTCDSNSLSFSRWTIRSDDTKQVQATTPWFSIIQIFAGNAQNAFDIFETVYTNSKLYGWLMTIRTKSKSFGQIPRFDIDQLEWLKQFGLSWLVIRWDKLERVFDYQTWLAPTHATVAPTPTPQPEWINWSILN